MIFDEIFTTNLLIKERNEFEVDDIIFDEIFTTNLLIKSLFPYQSPKYLTLTKYLQQTY